MANKGSHVNTEQHHSQNSSLRGLFAVLIAATAKLDVF